MFDRAQLLPIGLFLFLLTGTVSATPIEEALELIDRGQLSEARTLLTATIEDSSDTRLRSDALELLGDVEVWEENLERAREIWNRVLEEFPESVAASYARTKLRLVDEILGPMEEATVMEPARSVPTEAVQASAPQPESPAAEPAAAPDTRSEPEPVSAEPTPATQPVAEEPRPAVGTGATAGTAATAGTPVGAVLLAGDGKPPEAIEPVLDRVLEHLAEAGVEAVIPDQSLWWRRELEMVERTLLEESAGAGVLWLDFRFGHRERVRLRCIEDRGREAWAEQVKGGMGFADHRPHDIYNADLVERLLAKVDDRLGEACLAQRD